MSGNTGAILLIGASRGLGLGLAAQYLGAGWTVIATARDPAGSDGLKRLQLEHGDRLRVEALDVTVAGAGADLARRLHGTQVDVIFVVAGQMKTGRGAAHDASAEAAASEFLTNAYAPPILAEALLPCLADGGTVVFMTSILGSLANAGGGMELYSASKAALNMLGIGFAKRHPDLPVVLMHPGWVKTDMGGEGAPVEIEESVRGMTKVIAAHAGKPGIAYVDYRGSSLPW